MIVWPENIPALNLLDAVSTQWRVGMAGATGLEYASVFPTIDRLFRSLTEEQRDALFQDLQVMEAAALEAMRVKR